MNDDSHDYYLLVQNGTKLGLTKKLATKENVHVLSDDIDMFDNSFGIYEVSDEKPIASAKLLCQGYDGFMEKLMKLAHQFLILKQVQFVY
ncbi:unnamed protein product [Adineta steineri]|uniref:Uncharacterized protein n=1 Tax=Adineta steineri TaxID=433720 RepID=A0A814HY26_9BILA|nr:unnamed protein product [Adineta steineri]CAF1458069.1 unnamed protein product [Adineta steineri]